MGGTESSTFLPALTNTTSHKQHRQTDPHHTQEQKSANQDCKSAAVRTLKRVECETVKKKERKEGVLCVCVCIERL